LVPVSFGAPDAECKEPWYLQLNPNGKVPTIDDDGLTICESPALNLYLAEKYKSPMYPSTLQGKGKVLPGQARRRLGSRRWHVGQRAIAALRHLRLPLVAMIRTR